ncbi:MAG: Di-glucose binding within endoplasmic reticulum [Capsulimonas sp.]|nr:Di-glucose binding within endoplasmic reticulum [Capsulimonas sp.]
MKRIIAILWCVGAIAAASVFFAAPARAQFSSGVLYRLACKTGGNYLDNGGSVTLSANMGQWSNAPGNANQQWRFISLAGGKWQLISATSGMALDNGGSTANGAVVKQYTSSTSNTNQAWTITSAGGGYYQLVCASSGKALDNSGSTSNGTVVYQWDAIAGNTNQQWLITPVQIGAATPFTSYEAETATLGGGATSVALTSAPTTKFTSPQLEASGHAYAHLAANGQYVRWTNNTGQNVSALNVRYSIPDSVGGGGITSTLNLYVNGAFRQTIAVNSKQTWVYETDANYDGFNQTPSSGNPHVFWDEAHTFISGAAVTPGSTITLQKDAANSASYYNVDVVDLEAPPAALTQPANSLSIASYGAVANNSGVDSRTAIQNCINDAQTQGKSVWIPTGVFYLNGTSGLSANGITIQGAGMWYSTIYYNPTLPAASTNNVIQPNSCTLKNFAIDGNAVSNNAAGGNGGAINIKGSNWLIDSLWIQHEGAGVWADGTNGLVQNCRLGNTWADGINLNNGNTNNVGNNLTAQNNFVRGSGDDGIAINDDSTSQQMTSITVLNNTVVAPWWANNIGIYGGTNDFVANNLCTDSVKEYGISVGVFAGNGSPGSLLTAYIEGNTILRGGSYGYAIKFPGMGVGVSGTTSSVQNVTVCGNTISGSMFDGMNVYSGTNMGIYYNNIASPGLAGIVIDAGAHGNASFIDDIVQGLNAGQPAYTKNAPAANFSTSGFGNIGFTP